MTQLKQAAALGAARRGRSAAGLFRDDLVVVDCSAVGLAVFAGAVSGLSGVGPLLDDLGRLAVIITILVIWPTMLWARQTREGTILGAGIE